MMKTFISLLFAIIILSCSKDSGINTSDQIDYIKLGNLEIRTTDFAQMTPQDGETLCKNLGQGWRLPTLDEMIWICQNKSQIPNFVNGRAYWTSTLSGGKRYAVYYESSLGAYTGFFKDETSQLSIRAVR
jgi:hypothetical protein